MAKKRSRQKRSHKKKKEAAHEDEAELLEALPIDEDVPALETAIETGDESTESSIYVTANTSPEQLGREDSATLPESYSTQSILPEPADFERQLAQLLSVDLPDAPLSCNRLSLLVRDPSLKRNSRFMVILQLIHWLRRSSIQNFIVLEAVARMVKIYEQGLQMMFSIDTIRQIGTMLYDAALPLKMPWTTEEIEKLHRAAVKIVLDRLGPDTRDADDPTLPDNQPLDFRPLPNVAQKEKDMETQNDGKGKARREKRSSRRADSLSAKIRAETEARARHIVAQAGSFQVPLPPDSGLPESSKEFHTLRGFLETEGLEHESLTPEEFERRLESLSSRPWKVLAAF